MHLQLHALSVNTVKSKFLQLYTPQIPNFKRTLIKMALLIFVLDLPTLYPPLLSDVKQCLLQLANLYAFSAPKFKSKHRDYDSSVDDRIGLCYLQHSANSNSDEFMISYSPRGKCFSLCDFHYAVNRLPSDSYAPPFTEDSFIFRDLDFSSILGDELLHSACGKNIEKKIILISSCLVGNINSDMRMSLLDAADRCVSVEFVFFEQKLNQLSDVSEGINKFKSQICDLENCSFNAYIPDDRVLNGLVKRWIRELHNNEEIFQAHIIFQRCISGSVNEISCKLCNPTNQIIDNFSPYKPFRSCKNTGNGTDDSLLKDALSGYVGNQNQGPDYTDENSMKVYERTLLTEASWSVTNHCQMPSAVSLNVIERTCLSSLSDGVVVGKPYIVIPSASHESDTTQDESEKSQLNDRLFQGLCRVLSSLNQGLICWSFCNVETTRETMFHYYYILQPSDGGPMLLRRLAGGEEILPFPDINGSEPLITEEIINSVQQCLQEVQLKDYNPVHHIGGFHEKTNQLIQDSLQSGLDPDFSTTVDVVPVHPQVVKNVTALQGKTCPVIEVHEDAGIVQLESEQLVVSGTAQKDSVPSEPNSNKCLSEKWEQLTVGGTGMSMMDSVPSESSIKKSRTSPPATNKTLDFGTEKLAQEWQQLVVDGIPRICSVASEPDSKKCLSEEWKQLIVGGTGMSMVGSVPAKNSMEKSITSPSATNKPLDSRTSQILERLGNPKQIKSKVTSPTLVSGFANAENRQSGCTATADQGLTTKSCLMKPSFNRLKRKLR